MKSKTPTIKNTLTERSPVIVIMGHIDHGKSTLLDYIRKSNVVAGEAGGITQHMSAYEVVHTTKNGKQQKITFLDTPGHEAFTAIRTRGARVADIAILVVSAEDGVKTQTLEALKCILEEKIPYIVAINKIDKEGANIERTKQSLTENEIYLEGYGGTIPSVPISAKTGEGIPELLDMVLLVAEVEELKGDVSKNAEGIVIESNLDAKKGISGTIIIKDGALKSGMFIAAGESIAPVRIMEDFSGAKIAEAQFSTPVKIIGWTKLPVAGSPFTSFINKKEAESYALSHKNIPKESNQKKEQSADTTTIPVVVKADTSGSMDAIIHEIAKLSSGKMNVHVIHGGIGTIGENDVKLASATERAVLVGFNTKIDSAAANLAERLGLEIKTFDIIYKLTEWLAGIVTERTPLVESEELTGKAKVMKIFSKTKDKQIIGGKVESGILLVGVTVKIMRRESEIGTGKVRGLQQQKNKASEIKEGYEFGSMIESKIDIMPGDKLESYKTVVK